MTSISGQTPFGNTGILKNILSKANLTFSEIRAHCD